MTEQRMAVVKKKLPARETEISLEIYTFLYFISIWLSMKMNKHRKMFEWYYNFDEELPSA